MNVLSVVGGCISFTHRTTIVCLTLPFRLTNRIVVRPLVINVEIGLVSAGTCLTEIAHYCVHELRKAYLAAPHNNDFRLKLRLHDKDILWNYPVSTEDRRNVERKLLQIIDKKIGSNLDCVNSEVNDDSIEMTFAPAGPTKSTTLSSE